MVSLNCSLVKICLRRFIALLLGVLPYFSLNAQDKFQINLKSPYYIGKNLVLSTPTGAIGLENLYEFKLDIGDDVIDFRELTGFPVSSYSIKLNSINKLNGSLEYPIPVSFIYFDPEGKDFPVATNIFFIESQALDVYLPKITNKLDIQVNSPVNKEYKKLKKNLSEVYVKSNMPDKIDSLINFDRKQVLLSEYIKENPDSYVALWQIIEDYSVYNEHPHYTDNLKLFSEDVKNSKLFKIFEGKLYVKKQTSASEMMPDIVFDSLYSLTNDNFKKYRLTFIDYWSTTCAPCIKALPEIVGIFNEYKERGLNIISIADENTPKKMELSQKILDKNKAEWDNFFDIHKNFKNTVSANGYPLHFLVDSTGKILVRSEGNLNKIRAFISEYFK